MPIYAYRCLHCGEEFEKLVLSAAKADEAACPCCQSTKTERRPALFGLGGASAPGRSSESSCAPTGRGG